MREMRFFKQLEFLFPSQIVVAPSAVVGQAHRLPSIKKAGGAPALQFVHRFDHALEQHARELLRSLGANKLAREIRVEWNPRLKTCAGRTDYREKLISLNPLLRHLEYDPIQAQAVSKLECSMHSSLSKTRWDSCSHGNLECNMHSSLRSGAQAVSEKAAPRGSVHDEAERTLRHELAHLLAQFRSGRRRIAPHGKEWRQACRDLGIADEARCHNLPFATKVYAPRYVYRCPNCKEEFPRVRKIRRAVACLKCCRAQSRGQFDPRFRLRLISKA